MMIGNHTYVGGLCAACLLTSVWANAKDAPLQFGPLTVGGAIRANYIYGDYVNNGTGGAQRGANGGNFELDTFFINLDFLKGPFVGKAQYRWYDGYNFLRLGWVGYNFNKRTQVQVGLNRVPFGVGPYGPSHSWFFDQNYYVGLADDEAYGIKYTTARGPWKLAAAYYLREANSFVGSSKESARYSYAIVDNGGLYSHYTERNQGNIRAIYSLKDLAVPTDLGVSLQLGEIQADPRYAYDSYAYAAAIHSRSTWGPWNLMLQLSHYDYHANYKRTALDAHGLPLTDGLIAMGAYDFAWPVASQGTIPSVALGYTWKKPVPWLDSIEFYNDFSVILKDGHTPEGQSFNNSALNVTGMAIARGGWHIYVDYAWSNGNLFVGNKGDNYSNINTVGDFGVDGNNRWEYRFNINFGYYF